MPCGVQGSVLWVRTQLSMPVGIKLLPGKKSLSVMTLCARILLHFLPPSFLPLFSVFYELGKDKLQYSETKYKADYLEYYLYHIPKC